MLVNNKIFKGYISDKFLEFQLKNKNSRPPSKEELLEFINDVWYDPMLITEEIIIKSFKICGISNNLDGSEDEMFHWLKI